MPAATKRNSLAPSKRTPAGKDATVSAYMGKVGSVPLFTAAEERTAAEAIGAGRLAYWRALLSYPPHVEAIVVVVGDAFREPHHAKADPIGAAALDAVLVEASAAAVAARQYARLATLRRLDAATLALAHVVVKLDAECLLADEIAADLRRLGVREPPVLLRLRYYPRQGSAPWAEHFATVGRAGDAFRRARNRFVRANLRLVARIATGFRGWTLADLIQEGNMGLMKAACRFEPERGFRFSTYAVWWIRHSIRRGLHEASRLVRIPVHVHEKISKVDRARRALADREPTDAELAEAAGVAVATVKLAAQVMLAPLSFDARWHHPDQVDRALGDTIADPEPLAPEQLEVEARAARVRQALAGLDPRERDIITRRFGLVADKLTLVEIGELHGLSRERVRQLEARALETMRELVGDL